jgi:hypothetical protein
VGAGLLFNACHVPTAVTNAAVYKHMNAATLLCLPAVSYLLFPQPTFRGVSALQQLTPASFQSNIVDGSQSDETWLVSLVSSAQLEA